MGTSSNCKCCGRPDISQQLSFDIGYSDRLSDKLINNGDLTTTPDTQENIKLRSAKRIQNQFRKQKSIQLLTENLFEFIEKTKLDENPNLILKHITENEFSEKIKENNEHVEQIRKLYADQLDQIHSNAPNVYQLGPIELEDNNFVEYNKAQWNTKGEMCGKVILLSSDKSYYEGGIQNNLFEGKGLFIQPDGDYYFGNWKNGKCEGNGELNIQNNSSYSGGFKDNKKNGKGKEEYSDGSTYEGDFVDNEKEGNGIYTFPDGSYYRGKFKNSQFNGDGVYCWSDGRQYSGQFKAGQMNGQGCHKWADGSSYRGQYVNNKKNGSGIFQWNNGNTFYGNFVNNEPHGEGELRELSTGTNYQIFFRYGKIISSRSSNNNENKEEIKEEKVLIFPNEEMGQN